MFSRTTSPRQRTDNPSNAEQFSAGIVASSMHGLARFQKAESALHGMIYDNEEVASFRSGFRYTGQDSSPLVQEILVASEDLRRAAAQLGSKSLHGFTPSHGARLTDMLQTFLAKTEKHIVESSKSELAGRFLRNTAAAVRFAQSRHYSVVGDWWTELVNHSLEESALLCHMLGSQKAITLNPHSDIVAPAALVGFQSTVDAQRELRALSLQRQQGYLQSFAGLAREWIALDSPPPELVKATLKALKQFCEFSHNGRATDKISSYAMARADYEQSFLFEVQYALCDRAILRNPAAKLTKEILKKAVQICEYAQRWSLWNTPFVGDRSEAQDSEVAGRKAGILSGGGLIQQGAAPSTPSEAGWRMREVFTYKLLSLTRVAIATLSGPFKRDLFNLADSDNMLGYGSARLAARERTFLPRGPSFSTCQYGGSTGAVPARTTLEEYESFQRKHLIDLKAATPQNGLGEVLTADWIAAALSQNELTIIESRIGDRLLGVYFIASDENRLTALGEVVREVTNANGSADTAPAKQALQAKHQGVPNIAFVDLIAGVPTKDALSLFEINIPSHLHACGEAVARHENADRDVLLLAVCRTKPLNRAIHSHIKHGWVTHKEVISVSEGTESTVLWKLLSAPQVYDYSGELQRARRVPDVSALFAGTKP